MLLTSTVIPFDQRFGLYRAIDMLCEAGFRSIDIDLYNLESPLLQKNNSKAIADVKAHLDAFGAIAHQAHAPFPIGKDAYRIPEENVDVLLRRSLEVAGALGISQVIFHPIRIYDSTSEQRIEKNREILLPYGEYAKKCGTRIAVENLFCRHKEQKKKLIANACSTGEELAAMIDTLGEGFVACLDLGHAGLAGQSAAGMIRTLGKKRLHALHVHDNNYLEDQHLVPYQGDMDWGSIIDALAEIGYDDSFTFEAVPRYLHSLPESLCPSFLRNLYDIGTDFVKRIEEKKKAYGTL